MAIQTTIVVGGGFFGLFLADQMARQGHRVTVVEQDPELMTRASFRNQARVHQGYHYPRSILTALRSRVSFPWFVDEFRECVHSDFQQYYLIGRPLGKVTGAQFRRFCEKIGAPAETAPEAIQRLVDPNLIETVLTTVEYAFDAAKLKTLMVGRLESSGVKLLLGTRANRVTRVGTGLEVEVESALGERTLGADHVFNCTYSSINALLSRSNLPLIPLKHEFTEICLVEVPEALKKVGLTVMCGPYFSTMPFPPAGLHSFSHVRYTPHFEWHDDPASDYRAPDEHWAASPRHSAWRLMQADARRYIPLLGECQYRESLYEIKTVLPRSETDDSRPILFRPHHGLPGLHSIMGGKIDNVHDAWISIVRELGL